ncbi:MAG: insulinase family protein [Kofleriaceae bacterium]|nr:insulinase family protein [Kofleriaceae bacterium]MCL4226649.1 insulinase family protein [Myxococcales bacterium]
MNRLVAVPLVLVHLVVAACGPRPTPAPPAPTAPVAVAPADPTPPSPPEPPPVTQIAQPQELTFPDEPFRAEQPRPAPERPFKLPRVQTFKLKSGIAVYLVEQHTLPVVSLDLTFDGGAIADPAGKEGLASVCMAMMSEGTVRLDKLAFSEALADVASSVGAYAGTDTQGVSMSSLSKHLDVTFELFVETLRTPGFREADLERMIKRRLEGLKQAKGNPEAVAGRVAGPVLYGLEHPYGRVVTEASLRAITLDDCKAYHAAHIRPAGARLFVVGDLTAAQIRARFDGPALAGWSGKVPALPRMRTPARPAARIYFVDIPGAAQSQVSLTHFGPLRNAPDHLATQVMAAILGGGFTSRVNMNLREDKGYTYGARAGFSHTRQYGVLSAGGSIRSDATYQALLELHRELRELEQGVVPASALELERERASAVLGLASRFATASASLGMFRSLVYYGLPLDYWTSYTARVEKVTAAQVKAAAKKHLRSADALIVVVGDGKAPLVVRRDGKDVPFEQDGRQLTLREALDRLAAEATFGPGGLLVLDADGRPLT